MMNDLLKSIDKTYCTPDFFQSYSFPGKSRGFYHVKRKL